MFFSCGRVELEGTQEGMLGYQGSSLSNLTLSLCLETREGGRRGTPS